MQTTQAQDSMFDIPEPVGAEKPDVVLARRNAENVYRRPYMRDYWSQRAVHAQDVGYDEYAAYCRAQAAVWSDAQ